MKSIRSLKRSVRAGLPIGLAVAAGLSHAVDYSTLTADFSGAITAVLGIAASIFGVAVVIKAISMIKGVLGAKGV